MADCGYRRLMASTDPGASAGRTAVLPRLGVLREFLRTEAGGAVVLLGATVAAVVLANSAWADAYDALWATEVSCSGAATSWAWTWRIGSTTA